jgi:hypothetical protein
MPHRVQSQPKGFQVILITVSSLKTALPSLLAARSGQEVDYTSFGNLWSAAQ